MGTDITDVVKNTINTFLEALANHKSDIDVECKIGDRMITVTISANKEDIGKIIGKKGRTISSLRIIMQSIVANAKKRINIVVLD